jgi:arsenate reductase
MAEGWARNLKSDCLVPFSAGTSPKGIDPLAIKVMAEAGVDITNQTSKHIDSLREQNFDFVVTVCGVADETCPDLPSSAKRTHVGFEDPPKLAERAKTEEEKLMHYRRVRDQIRSFIETLPDAL